MAKADFSFPIRSIHGRVGNLIIRQCNGKAVLSRAPVYRDKPTDAQLAQRARFRAASRYARRVAADPVLAAKYAERAPHQSIYQAAMADYLNRPAGEEPPRPVSYPDPGAD